MTIVTLKINEQTKVGHVALDIIEFLSKDKSVSIVKENKTKAIRRLSDKINKAAALRLLQHHNLCL